VTGEADVTGDSAVTGEADVTGVEPLGSSGAVPNPAERRPIRVVLPHHLRTLAGTGAEVVLEVAEPVTIAAVLDALEARYPPLRGTIRDLRTGARRAFIRYFAAGEDLSFEAPEAVLPASVLGGAEPFRILGAIAGG
jgi:hypothetical protein